MHISNVIVGNLLTSLFGRIIGAFGPILLVPLMIRAWGLDVYGEWLILTAIPAYIMLAPDFGLAGAVVNRMAYLTAGGNEQEAIYLYRSSFFVLIIAASSFVALGWLVAWWLDWSKFGVKILEPAIATSIIGWSCVQIFIAQQGFLLSGIYKSARLNPRFGLLGSLSGAFILGVGILVLWLGGSPYQYVVGITLINAIFFMVLFMDSRRIMPNFTLSLQGVSLKKIRPYILPGLGHAGMPLIYALQNQGTLVVLGALFGSVNVAIFQTARILSNGVKALLGILSSSIMVELASLLGDNQKKIIQHLLVRNFQVGLIATFFAILTMASFGEDIYKLWLGKAGFYDNNLLILLFISLIPFTISSSYNIFLLASNNIHRTIIPMLGAAISSILILTLSAYWINFSIVGVIVLFWEILLAVIAIFYASKMDDLDIQKMTKDFFNLSSIGKDFNHLITMLLSSIISLINSMEFFKNKSIPMDILCMGSNKPMNSVVKTRKIMYIGYPFHSAGAPHQGMAALWLARSNFYIDYFAWGNELPPIWLKDYSTINYHVFNKNGVLSACSFLIKLVRYILHTKPDYIYVQGAQQTPFFLWLSFIKIKSKLIYHTQDYLGPGQHLLYEACERFLAHQADWVISNEVNRARFMASNYRLTRMPDTIRTALPSWWLILNRDEDYRRELLNMAGIHEAQQPRLIVAGGGYAVDRMSPEVLIALSQLPRSYALVFTGMEPKSPRYRACMDQIANLGLQERVLVLGHLSYAELLRLYAASDLGILLYPNSCVGHFYQAPGRLTEYLRCGLPIVTSNFPGLELMALKYELGAVANPYQPNTIAEAIMRIVNVDDIVLAAARYRLMALAQTQFAYEYQASKVFGKIFKQE